VHELEQYQPSGTSAAAIAASVEDAIDAGRLQPGDALPSVRELARTLGVAPATVSSALRELRTRGLVTAEPRRAVRVAGAPPLRRPVEPVVPPGARDVTGGNPDPALLPDLAPHLARIASPPHLYGQEAVLPELAARARASLEDDGIDAGHLTVLSGTLDALERALTAYLRPGDRVAVEDPGYGTLLDLLRAMGLDLVPVAIDGRGPRPEALGQALAAGARALVVTPRAQNPTGSALDEARAAELVRVLDGHPDVLLFEDDHAGAVAGAPHHTLTAGRTRWAVARSTAKALGPDLRLSIVAGDARTVSRVEGRHRLGPGWVSWVLQRLAADLMGDAKVQELLAVAAATYRARSAALIEALDAHGIEAVGGSGLNVWIPVPSEAAPLQALLAEGWVAAPGDRFRLASPPAIRITTASLPERDAPALAAVIARAVRPSGRGAAA
jgi:DNA-binding transcriptional MocR family regulator